MASLLRTRIPMRPSKPPLQFAAYPRTFHQLPPRDAHVAPIVGTGPPPEPPIPSPDRSSESYARIMRRRRQAELLRKAGDIRAKGNKGVLAKRFWGNVMVREVDGALQIHLDDRPLRHPTTRAEIRLPLSKTHLATALAIEWDHLTSAQDATKQHLIPLTSLICRALDISDEGPSGPIRESIASTLLRYLDTDSLLCWAPEGNARESEDGITLRKKQERAAAELVANVTASFWPGIQIEPALEPGSILPKAQSDETREVVRAWINGLGPWDLAGLERATIAAKSLLIGTRLLSEWSEIEGQNEGRKSFDVEEAARMASLEVQWQIDSWGEVEDTHDVEREDLKRQLGSVVLLVSGSG